MDVSDCGYKPLNLNTKTGIIKIPREGFVMPREYQHIEQYEKEIVKLKEECTHQES